MSKVYLVTSGEYSDYGVRAIFSTREAATKYCWNQNTHGGTVEGPGDDLEYEYRVEEYEMDRPPEEWPGAYWIYIDDDGSSYYDAQWGDDDSPRQPARIITAAKGKRLFQGFGSTPEHARRSAEELRRQTLALEGKVVTAKNA